MLSTLSMLRDTGTARARRLLLHFPVQLHDKPVWVGQQYNLILTLRCGHLLCSSKSLAGVVSFGPSMTAHAYVLIGLRCRQGSKLTNLQSRLIKARESQACS